LAHNVELAIKALGTSFLSNTAKAAAPLLDRSFGVRPHVEVDARSRLCYLRFMRQYKQLSEKIRKFAFAK